MPYSKTNWVNGETPINQTNLNHIENGIKSNADALTQLSTKVVTDWLHVNDSHSASGYVDIDLGTVEATTDIVAHRYVEGREDVKTSETTLNTLAHTLSTLTPTLTSSSPLAPTLAFNIRGIDAKGKSVQNVSANLANPSAFTKNAPYHQADGSTTQASGIGVQTISASGSTAMSIAITNNTALSYRIAYLDSSNNFISRFANSALNYNFTTPSNCAYIEIACDGAIYDGNIGYFSIAKGSNVPYSAYTGQPTPSDPIPIVDASAVVTAFGGNLWDAHYGYHNTSSGFASGQANSIGCSDHIIPCTVGQKFRVTTDNVGLQMYVGYYNSNSAFIERVKYTENFEFTIPSGCAYYFVSVWASSITESNYKSISVVINDSNQITLPYVLKSVGTVADELIVNPDGSGKLIRRIGTVDISTLTWRTSGSGASRYYAEINDGKIKSELLCTSYPCQISSSYSDGKISSDDVSGHLRLFANDTNYATVEDFKRANNGQTLYYVLTTPTTTPLTASQINAILTLSTYNDTTVVDSEMDVDVTYVCDVIEYINSLLGGLASEV